MSSMVRKSRAIHLPQNIALLTLGALAMTASAPQMNSWEAARAQLVASQPSRMAQVIDRWQFLTGNDSLAFEDYAGFVLAYPGFPQESRLQLRAENALGDEPIGAERMVAYFDRNPPLSNPARARYALALASVGRDEAAQMALEAWRGGKMSGPSEIYLNSLFGSRFGPEDHDARMDALLWQGEADAAARQMMNVSPAWRDVFMARLALARGSTPQAQGLAVPAQAQSDPGYVYALAKYYRTRRQLPQAINLLANRERFARPAFDAEDFVGEMLRIARGAGSGQAARIAGSVDDLFAPGADISSMAYKLRDDYTSLMWLGGTKSLWNNGDGRTAAPLFYRYGAAARTPQTRSKGFYWAGLASERAGDRAGAQRYYDMAAAYPDRFYGQLALDKLGRSIPSLASAPASNPTQQQRAEFANAPLTGAVRHVARGAPWRTGIQFYQAIARNADTPEEHILVSELARQTGRRDLAVNVAEAAAADGLNTFVAQGFPTMDVPPGGDWTFIHAISRQESQFAENAISHAGARGLMQLMPGTAREQAGQLGKSYQLSALIDNPRYNVELGNAYFRRMLNRYNGSYPLAVAAYNAGPGNVNKWLRRNGDPRNGGVDWVTWIERIPIFETKNYVQRVLENAAVYEHLNPDKATFGRPRRAGEFLR